MNAKDPDSLHSPQEWWLSSPAELADALDRVCAECDDDGDLHWALFDYYNHLMSSVSVASRETIARAEAVVAYFKLKGELEFEAMFLELVARAGLSAGYLSQGLAAFERMAEIHADEFQLRDVRELAGDIGSYAKYAMFGSDLLPVLFSSIARTFQNLGDHEELARAYLHTSALYAQHGAYEAARRAVQDARTIAENADLLLLVAETYEQEAVLAYEDSDAAGSVAAATVAIELHEAHGSSPPVRLQVNLATALMELGHVDEAADIYEAMISSSSGTGMTGTLFTNLASCRRRQGNLAAAHDCVARARTEFNDETPYEYLLELEIVDASIAFAAKDSSAGAQRLRDAAVMLDRGLSRVLRLHHRRGLRNQYIRLIEGRLFFVAADGPASDVLPIIAVVYGSVIADWLAVLDWKKRLLANEEASQSQLTAMRNRIEAVQAFGAPFALRDDEETDSPWDPLLNGKPWDDLGETISRLVGEGHQSPFEAVSLAASTSLLQRRLAEGWCIVLPTFGSDPVSLWVFHGDRYTRHALPLSIMAEWQKARRAFAQEAMKKAEFASQLDQFSSQVRDLLRNVLDKLPYECPGILSLQDFGNILPITAVVLGHDGLRARMADGAFEVKLVPALYQTADQSPLVKPKLVALIDSDDDLGLARLEAGVAAETIDARCFHIIEAGNEAALIEHMDDAAMLVVSTHGVSISNFSDPFLGSLGGAREHAINVKTLQARFVDLPYKLVMLNACHAGATVIDSERGLRTHDAASYPALLLLNRSSIVSAASWRIGDTISYLHLVLVAEGLKVGLSPSRALSRAVARLYELPTPDAEVLIKKARVTPGREGALRILKSAPPTGAFKNLYLLGGIEAFGLL